MASRPQNIGIKAIEIYFPSQVCFVLFVITFSTSVGEGCLAWICPMPTSLLPPLSVFVYTSTHENTHTHPYDIDGKMVSMPRIHTNFTYLLTLHTIVVCKGSLVQELLANSCCPRVLL